MSPGKGLSLQWDVGSSIFSLGSAAMNLIKAATVDDVQPAAILAAEAIGSIMLVEPRLIGKAVDALGGGQSFRIEHLKLQIGLSSGGVAAELRKSTPAVRSFLLIAALQFGLKKDEIAEVLYEMLSTSGLINRIPVSENQLASLIGLLEGHAISLSATEPLATCFIQPLAGVLASKPFDKDSWIREEQQKARQALFLPLPAPAMANLLYRFFQSMQSEDTTRINVCGSSGAVPLLSAICWLVRYDVSIKLDNQWIYGADRSSDTKAHFLLDSSKSQDWTLEEYQGLGKISSIIIPAAARELPERDSMIPLQAVRSYFDSVYGAQAGESIGQIALAIVITAYAHLRLRIDADKIYVKDTVETRTVRLEQVCTTQFSMTYSFATGPLGWDAHRDLSRAREISEFMVSCLDKRIDVHGFLVEFEKFLGSYGPYDIRTSLRQARMVADHIVYGALIKQSGLHQHISIDSLNGKHHGVLERLILGGSNDSVRRGIFWTPNEFVEHALRTSPPGLHNASRPGLGPLIISGGGLVIYPTALLSYSTQLKDLMTYEMIPGHMSFKMARYPALVELNPTHPTQGSGILPCVKEWDSVDQPRRFQAVRGPMAKEYVTYSIAKKSDYLVLAISTENGARASFTYAQMHLLCAYRFDRLDFVCSTAANGPEVALHAVKGCPAYLTRKTLSRYLFFDSAGQASFVLTFLAFVQ